MNIDLTHLWVTFGLLLKEDKTMTGFAPQNTPA